MPFKPGQSGNPGGKPRGAVRITLREARDKASAHIDDALACLSGLCAKWSDPEASDKDRATARAAANDILTWALGRASAWADEETGLPADFAGKPDEEKRRLLLDRVTRYNQALAVLEKHGKADGTVQ